MSAHENWCSTYVERVMRHKSYIEPFTFPFCWDSNRVCQTTVFSLISGLPASASYVLLLNKFIIHFMILVKKICSKI